MTKVAESLTRGRYVFRRVCVMSPLRLSLSAFLSLHPLTYFKGRSAAVQVVDLAADLEFEVWLAVAEDNVGGRLACSGGPATAETGPNVLWAAVPESMAVAWLSKLEAAYQAESMRRHNQDGLAA